MCDTMKGRVGACDGKTKGAAAPIGSVFLSFEPGLVHPSKRPLTTKTTNELSRPDKAHLVRTLANVKVEGGVGPLKHHRLSINICKPLRLCQFCRKMHGFRACFISTV